MTIECYYRWCKYHGVHIKELGWDGPFCYEEGCLANEVELILFRNMRREEVMKIEAEPTNINLT